jgi:hypothetical protein
LYVEADFRALTWFCTTHGIGINIVRVSRENPRRVHDAAHRAIEDILHGSYDPATVYYFPDARTWNAAKLTASPDDLVIVADGRHLLLPGAKPGGASPADQVVRPSLGAWWSFAASEPGAGFLIEGWLPSESWGTWSDGLVPSILLPLPRGYRGKVRVAVRWRGHADPGIAGRIQVAFDRAEFPIEFEGDVQRDSAFEVVAERDYLAVRFQVRRPTGPGQRWPRIGVVAVQLTTPDLAPRAPDAPTPGR